MIALSTKLVLNPKAYILYLLSLAKKVSVSITPILGFSINKTLLLGFSIHLSLIFCFVIRTLLLAIRISFSPDFLTTRLLLSFISITRLITTPSKEYLIFSKEDFSIYLTARM